MKKKYWPLLAAVLLSLPAAANAQSADSNGWTFDSGRIIGGLSAESGVRLMDPVVMDFDGDGIQDMVFGAPAASPAGIYAAGSLYVLSGKKDLTFSGQRDMTFWSNFDYRFDGVTTAGQFGMSIYTGDFNGDGKTDIAVAEPGQKGAVHVFYGGKQRAKGIHKIFDIDGADLSFVGDDIGSLFGISGCVGDFNRDGVDDLSLSYLAKNTTYANHLSEMIIIPMRSHWDKKRYAISDKLNGKTVLARAVSSNLRVVHTCAAGDFNDDGVEDIALGMPFDAYQSDKAAGSVSIIYQPHKYGGTVVDLGNLDEKYGIRIFGTQANAQFGYALSAADFTGDGRTDLAVSSPNRLIKGPQTEGAVYILDGNHLPKTTGPMPDDTLTIKGNGGQFGYKLTAADVNADQRKDLVIAAPTAGQLNNGILSIYLGGPHFVESILHTLRADITLSGADFMGFGIGAAFGDLNGDEKIDMIARTTADTQQRSATGAYTVLGNIADFPQSSTLSDNYLTLSAPSKGGELSAQHKTLTLNDKTYTAWFSPKGLGSRSLICLVDQSRSPNDDIALTADNTCDFQIIGPENYPIADFDFTPSPTLTPTLTISVPDMPVKKSIGFVAAIPLPETLPKQLVLNLNEQTLKTQAKTFLLSGEPAASLGEKIQWADLDGDGFNELIIGAPKRIIDSEQSGSIFIVKGSAQTATGFVELTDKKTLQFEGFLNEQIGKNFQIIDLNADGTPDLALSAKRTPNASGEEHATVYVIFNPALRQPKAYSVRSPEVGALQIVSPQAQTDLELLPAEDLNDDGVNDLVLISPNYRAGIQRDGIVYGIFADTSRKNAILELKNSTLSGFSLTAGRNERLIDARFTRINGKKYLITIARNLLTGAGSNIEVLTSDDGKFIGQFESSKLKSKIRDLAFDQPVTLRIASDPEQKNDDIWLIFTDDGLTASGQGIARHVAPFNAP